MDDAKADYALRREYHAAYRAAHRERHRASNVAWRSANPETVRRITREWRERTGGDKAHSAVESALESGRLTKEPCSACGNPKSEAHHYLGYAREHWLDVIWLCHQCHMTEHHNMREAN